MINYPLSLRERFWVRLGGAVAIAALIGALLPLALGCL